MTRNSNNREKKISSRKKDKDSSTDLMDTLKNFVRTRGPEFLKDPNISSVGIARKKKDGKPTNELAIRFTVKQKAELEELESLGTKAIPESIVIEGIEVPTDVIQREYQVEYKLVTEMQPSDRKIRLNPITPGISVGHPTITAGTIGCIVYDKTNGTPYILSNWHVLNGPLGAIGDDIVQPGTHDDNRINMNRL